MTDQEKEQYNNICKKEFEDIKRNTDEKFEIVQRSLDKFYVAIFEGNGEPALRTDIKMLKSTMSGIVWLGSIVLTALIGSVVTLWVGK